MQYDSSLVFDSEVIPGVTYTLHKPSYGRTLAFDVKNSDFRQKSRELQKRQEALREELDFIRKQWDDEQEAKVKALKQEVADATNEDKPALQAQIDKIENGWQYERLLDRARVTVDEQHVKEIAAELIAIGENKTVFQMPRELADGFRELGSEAEFLKAESYFPKRLQWGLAQIDGIDIDGSPATADSLLQSGPTDLVREILSKIDLVNGMTAEQLRNFKSRTILEKSTDGDAISSTVSSANLPDSILAETA